MDGLCQQFLAGAGFPHDQNRDVAPEHLLNLVDYRGDLRIAGIEVAQTGETPLGLFGMSTGIGLLRRLVAVGFNWLAVRLGDMLKYIIGETQLRAPANAHAIVQAQVEQSRCCGAVMIEQGGNRQAE